MSSACPICGKPVAAAYEPFCGKRCADIDLHRWLTGSYVAVKASGDEDADISLLPEPSEE